MQNPTYRRLSASRHFGRQGMQYSYFAITEQADSDMAAEKSTLYYKYSVEAKIVKSQTKKN